jgi:spermidine/putrescine-binding protein
MWRKLGDTIFGTRKQKMEKCNSLASWDMVCKPKKRGGLGIINLKIQNQGLLLKYLHKFYNRDDTPG